MSSAAMLFSICAGIALAAACGFRVFIPLLIASVAARHGLLHPSHGFIWITCPASTTIIGAAAVVEIAAFSSLWVAHFLDIIALPLAAVAGVFVSAMAFGTMDPALKWTIAAVAGAGVAGASHSGAMASRAASSAVSLGGTIRAFGLIESLLALILSALAVIAPVMAVVAVTIVVFWIVRRFNRVSKQPA